MSLRTGGGSKDNSLAGARSSFNPSRTVCAMPEMSEMTLTAPASPSSNCVKKLTCLTELANISFSSRLSNAGSLPRSTSSTFDKVLQSTVTIWANTFPILAWAESRLK
eukprot:1377472-Pyramimonas_sp.AAC.2